MSKKIEKYLIENSWYKQLQSEFNKDYFQQLKDRIEKDAKTHILYPKSADIFKAFNLCPFEKVKIVIIGQDPYHGEDQANGLAFSVVKNLKIPPSLKNIFKELSLTVDDFKIPHHGDLTDWAKQGVFLLNSSLTVKKSQASSHSKIGWQNFTDRVVELLSQKRNNLVFILWGAHAIKKGAAIDHSKHLVVQSVHPSPLSAHRGFFKQNHFNQANKYLKSHNIGPIDWHL